MCLIMLVPICATNFFPGRLTHQHGGDAVSATDGSVVVPYHRCPLMPVSAPWSGAAARSRLREWAGPDLSRLEEGFAYVRVDGPLHASSYKLPHHDVEDGVLMTNWHGVASAMAAVLGAHGGVSLPVEERRRIYEHLAHHYQDFGRTPPPFH